MEKRKPHYDLAAVKIAVQQRRADGSIVIQFKEK